MTLKEAADKYVELTTWIRELSSPRFQEIEGAEEYRQKLMLNFRRVGEISQINADVLANYLTPVLDSDELLTQEEVDALVFLKDKMLDATEMVNLDIAMLYLVTMRIYEDARRKDNVPYLIRALDDYVMCAYALLIVTLRILPFCNSADICREKGLEAADQILSYLEPEAFSALPVNIREIILTNARYVMALHEEALSPVSAAQREENISILRRALSLKDDPFYRDMAPDYDWIYHEFRTLEYFSRLTGLFNAGGYDEEQLKEINGYAKRLGELWENYADRLNAPDSYGMIQLTMLRNACLNGEISGSVFRNQLLSLMQSINEDAEDYDEIIMITSVPLEYILSIGTGFPSKKQQEAITQFYRKLIRHVHRLPKRGHLSFLLSELSLIIERFIDIPDGIDFETMCLELMASVHPPTYVHSLSVADLSACLARHLLRLHPEMFENIPGYPDEDAVREFIWHAAVCHDIGKLFILETITTYGRSLYDREFDWIRTHPEVGASLLSAHESTAAYADVARFHHRWYNGQGGYPEEYRPEDHPNRVCIELVACADCLDAATDSVGRSYKQGKSIDDFMEELKKGSGTRYAPYLPELFEDREVYHELVHILDAGRDDKYHQTYRILENLMM